MERRLTLPNNDIVLITYNDWTLELRIHFIEDEDDFYDEVMEDIEPKAMEKAIEDWIIKYLVW